MKALHRKCITLKKYPIIYQPNSSSQITKVQKQNFQYVPMQIQSKSIYSIGISRKERTSQSAISNNAPMQNAPLSLQRLPSLTKEKELLVSVRTGGCIDTNSYVSSASDHKTIFGTICTDREFNDRNIEDSEGLKKEILFQILSKLKGKLNKFKERQNFLLVNNERLKNEIGRAHV